MHDPVIGLDENKRILFMNDIALKISGMKAENVMGKAIAGYRHAQRPGTPLPANYLTRANQYKQTTIKIYADNKESYFEEINH